MAIYKFYCGECEEEFEDDRALEKDAENGECVVCGSTEVECLGPVEVAEVECGGEAGICDDDCGCGCC